MAAGDDARHHERAQAALLQHPLPPAPRHVDTGSLARRATSASHAHAQPRGGPDRAYPPKPARPPTSPRLLCEPTRAGGAPAVALWPPLGWLPAPPHADASTSLPPAQPRLFTRHRHLDQHPLLGYVQSAKKVRRRDGSGHHSTTSTPSPSSSAPPPNGSPCLSPAAVPSDCMVLASLYALATARRHAPTSPQHVATRAFKTRHTMIVDGMVHEWWTVPESDSLEWRSFAGLMGEDDDVEPDRKPRRFSM